MTRNPRTAQQLPVFRPAGPLATTSEFDEKSRPLLLAYIHLLPGTSAISRTVVQEYVRKFAEAGNFELLRVFIGYEGVTDHLTLRDLVEQIRLSGPGAVLVAGPGRAALSALHQIAGVRVLTLASIGHGTR